MNSSKGSFEQRRHVRKYAEGELSEDRSFYFKGPQGKLNLRAQNLNTFTQLADGVDDETWLHHLRRSDYSAWMESVIKDDELVEDIKKVEREVQDPRKSRERIKEAITSRYTAAA